MDDILKRTAAGLSAFNKIGTHNGSAPPPMKDNRAPLVYEAHISQKLAKLATARKDAAIAKLYDAGILTDDYQPGDYTPFAAEGMSVSVKRNNDSETIDNTKLKNELTKKLGKDEAEKLLKLCSKPRKGNTTITVGVM